MAAAVQSWTISQAGIKSGQPVEGYDTSWFLKDPPENFLCPICSSVGRNLVEASCGHCFCGLCIQRWLTNNATCPEDRLPLKSADLRVCVRDNRDIQSLHVKCPQCSNTMELRELDNHLAHLCLQRSVSCTVCHAQMLAEQLLKHDADALAQHNGILVKTNEHLVAENARLKLELLRLSGGASTSSHGGAVAATAAGGGQLAPDQNRLNVVTVDGKVSMPKHQVGQEEIKTSMWALLKQDPIRKLPWVMNRLESEFGIDAVMPHKPLLSEWFAVFSAVAEVTPVYDNGKSTLAVRPQTGNNAKFTAGTIVAQAGNDDKFAAAALPIANKGNKADAKMPYYLYVGNTFDKVTKEWTLFVSFNPDNVTPVADVVQSVKFLLRFASLSPTELEVYPDKDGLFRLLSRNTFLPLDSPHSVTTTVVFRHSFCSGKAAEGHVHYEMNYLHPIRSVLL